VEPVVTQRTLNNSCPACKQLTGDHVIDGFGQLQPWETVN
jgi:hypothetical protein